MVLWLGPAKARGWLDSKPRLRGRASRLTPYKRASNSIVLEERDEIHHKLSANGGLRPTLSVAWRRILCSWYGVQAAPCQRASLDRWGEERHAKAVAILCGCIPKVNGIHAKVGNLTSCPMALKTPVSKTWSRARGQYMKARGQGGLAKW